MSDPVQSRQAQRRFSSWSIARAFSNTCSINGSLTASSSSGAWITIAPVHAAQRPDTLSVYLPNPESELSRVVIKGSAIVGLSQPNGKIVIYFEGNRLEIAELRLYRQRAERAATRLLFNYPLGYPTRARDVVEARDVEPIGTLDLRSGRLNISRPAVELSWWIDESDLVDLGLIAPATG